MNRSAARAFVLDASIDRRWLTDEIPPAFPDRKIVTLTDPMDLFEHPELRAPVGDQMVVYDEGHGPLAVNDALSIAGIW